MSFWETMKSSLADNMYIIIAAVVDAVLLVVIFISVFLIIAKYLKENGEGGPAENKFFSRVYRLIEGMYSLFICIISLFPFFGMFGTVQSLIEMGSVFETADGGDMGNIKSKFFLALTSTAWGIIFSVIFKIVHSLVQPFIEDTLDKAKERLDRAKLQPDRAKTVREENSLPQSGGEP